QYDIGDLLSYKGIAEGVENSNFLLHTSAGYFILTLYEKRVAKGDLPFFLALMTHLAGHGIICPQPVKNQHGEALSMLAGRPAAIINFLDERVSGIIDFTFACTDILAYDVAICLNAWCFESDCSFNVTKARAFLGAYGRERKLSDAEQDALPLLARGAALRFLLTRLVD